MLKPILYIVTSNPNYSSKEKNAIRSKVKEYISSLTSKDNLPFKLVQDSGLYLEVHALVKIRERIVAGTRGGIYISDNGGLSWNQSINGLKTISINCLATDDASIFVGINGGGIFRSDDFGVSWNNVSGDKLISSTVNTIHIKDSSVYVGTDYGIFVSTDNGVAWEDSNSGIPYVEIAPNPEYPKEIPAPSYVKINCINSTKAIFAGTLFDGVFAFDGSTWTEKNKGITDLNIKTLAVNGSIIYAGTNKDGLFISEDSGESWVNIGLSGNCINAICANDRSIIAGTDNGVFITIDNGNIWTDVSSGLPVVRTYALLQDRENLFIGTYFGGVFLSSDNGLTWIEMNSGLNPYIGSILFPLDTVLPQFAESFSKYDAAPIVNQKTGQIAKPFIDLTAVAQKERDVIAYESGEFPEVIMLQLTGHVTGKVKE